MVNRELITIKFWSDRSAIIIDFECEDHIIFGVNQHLESINSEFRYSGCNILAPLHVDRNDYIKLALASGGHLWQLKAIRANNIAYAKYLAAEMVDAYRIGKLDWYRKHAL